MTTSREWLLGMASAGGLLALDPRFDRGVRELPCGAYVESQKSSTPTTKAPQICVEVSPARGEGENRRR
jgi:hypothetical protein